MGGNRSASCLFLSALVLAGWAGAVPALDPDKAFHHYVRSTWSIEHGLPQISALAIAQDRAGYLWVGTQAGLARFDGSRFTTYNPENTPGLPGIWISSLYVDPEDRVWVGTYRGLAVQENGGFRSVRRSGPAGSVPLDVRDVKPLASGEVAVAGPEGVYVVEGDELGLRYPLPGPANALLTREDGLWVGSQGNVYRILDSQIEILPLPAGDAGTVVTELADAQGRLWAGTSAGLFFRDGDGWTRYEGGEPLSRTPIEVLQQDSDGNLWVGMVRGLARLWAGRVDELVSDDPVGIAPRAIFEDREGNLWMGSQWEGLTRLWDGWTRRYSTHEGLGDRTLWSVARGRGGEVWAGTNSGLSVFENGRFREVVRGDELPHPNAYTLLVEDGTVWIGTRRGAVVLRDGRVETLPELAPMRSAQISGIVRDRRGALWFATSQGLFRLARGNLDRFGTDQGLRDPRTRLVYETRAGELLVGTQAGLYRFEDGSLLPVGLGNGLRGDLDITAIHELPDGDLVVGALSEEIFLGHDGRWTAFTRGNGMPVNSAFFITNDSHGYLWVAGIRGVHRVPLADLLAVAEGDATRVDGEMILNERGDRRGGQQGYCCNGAGNAKGYLDDGELWLPSRDGIVVLPTGGVVRNAVAPRTLVERVRVLGEWRTADPRADWRLPRNARDLDFEFTVLSFQEPRSVDLRYRLLGYDEDWRQVEDTTRRVANYTNLPPGAYVFEVMGANNADVWSTAPAQLGFRIEPRFDETPLFRALLALLAASVLYAFFRRQTGRHQRQRQALEQLVGERTEALEVANRRLEDASQTDPLTGLRNRRYLGNQIPADIAFYDRELLRGAGLGEVMVFALVDIDHFKAINDNHGHAAGDRVLQQFAQVLGRLVRTGDYLARWGGEEFLLVFRPMPPDQLPVLGERILAAVRGHAFDVGSAEPVRLGCSIGFVECPLTRDARGRLGWEQMIELADRALYHVKDNGRNGWAAFRPGPGMRLDEMFDALRGDAAPLLAAGHVQVVGSKTRRGG